MPKGVRLGGRQKGTPNKATADVREAIAELAKLNIPKLNEWLKRVSLQDPARAAEILLRALEYHIPKLGRTEVTGKDGGPVAWNLTIDLGAAKQNP